jgi:hypothetical protein
MFSDAVKVYFDIFKGLVNLNLELKNVLNGTDLNYRKKGFMHIQLF